MGNHGDGWEISWRNGVGKVLELLLASGKWGDSRATVFAFDGSAAIVHSENRHLLYCMCSLRWNAPYHNAMEV